MRMTRDEAEALVHSAFVAVGVTDASAWSVARALVAAEVDGQKGHGFSRIVAYAAQVQSGKVAGDAEPRVAERKAAMIRVDAGHGFAFPAMDLAIDELAGMVANAGMAAAAIWRSHHCGQLGAHVERLAERGFAALMVANTPKAMAPWGGHAALFGTNPIAFAAPRADRPPLVIDLSLSKVARGKVMAASRTGDPIPEGWALDVEGNPTTDPKAAMAGTMIPAGDAKGAALALLVEVLAATLTGAKHSNEATSFFDAEGAPPGVGQFLVAFETGSGFAERLEELLSEIAGQGARVPGTRRLEARARVEAEGLEVPQQVLDEVAGLVG
ncbi:MAG: Ldh family oxidoreductase [Pseudomonadota bacterium]